MPYEKDFHTEVHKVLVYEYGLENVQHEVYLESGRWVDFLVDTGLFKVALEVETSGEKFSEGLGQAYLYSAHSPEWLGAVAYPTSRPEEDIEYIHGPVGFIPFEWEDLQSDS